MADIIISGMEMPSNCAVCKIICKLFTEGKTEDAISGRQDGCPLGELPPHGRLIDADALMDGWMNLREATKYGNKTAEQQSHSYSTMMMYEIADEIEDAPTIIPASGGES